MGDTRPVLLGMNNPYGADPAMALYPLPSRSAGGRLQAMSGLSRGDYLRLFDRRNVLTGEWSAARAKEARAALRSELAGRHVIVLGAEVNSVMRGGTEHELAPPFRWTPDGVGGWIAKAPHPSGRSTFYNDPLSQDLLRIFLEEALWHTTHAPAAESHSGSLTTNAQNVSLGAAQGTLL